LNVYKIETLFPQDTTYGIPKDPKRALVCYYHAAEYGMARAQNNIGGLYSEEGPTKDLVEAFRWFLLAASRGMSEAKYNVGRCYRWGYGVRQDMKECIRWYRISAEDGFPLAIEALGTIYETGDEAAELLPNPQEALRWYRTGALKGLKHAQYELGCHYEGKHTKIDINEARYWFGLAAAQGSSKSKQKLQDLS